MLGRRGTVGLSDKVRCRFILAHHHAAMRGAPFNAITLARVGAGEQCRDNDKREGVHSDVKPLRTRGILRRVCALRECVAL